jgi:uncharacterized protein (UPF0332 family)
LDKEIKMRIKAYSVAYDRLKREEEIIENNVLESRKVSRHLDRAKDDFLLAAATKKLIENEGARMELGMPEDYPNLHHWLIIHSYYAMYHAATAAVAKKKIRSQSHKATITALAKHYVTGEQLELDFIRTLEYVYLAYIESGRESRQGAQYNVDREYSKEEAYDVFENAGKFVKRIAELLE